MKYTQTFAEAYRQVRLRKEDHEASMAIGQLKTIQDNLNQLMSILQSKGSDYELEAWVQSKITSANDKMTSAADYMKNSPSVSEAKEDDGEALDGDHGTIEDRLKTDTYPMVFIDLGPNVIAIVGKTSLETNETLRTFDTIPHLVGIIKSYIK